jgi:hypothetical protein
MEATDTTPGTGFELINAVKARFPNARFSVSCFKSIEEIETKVLAENTEQILYTDLYTIVEGRGKKAKTTEFTDYFIIKRRQGEQHIFYKDVIDQIIEQGFYRDDCSHRYMERIGPVHRNSRYPNSCEIYGSFWGS